MTINVKAPAYVKFRDKELHQTDNFTYLGSVITPDGGTREEIYTRLDKARRVFRDINSIYRTALYSTSTKLKLHQSCVLSTLLYWSECWRIAEPDLKAMKQTCGSIAKLAPDRKGWRKFVAALYITGWKGQWWWWWRLISFSLLAFQASRRLKIIFKELRQNYYKNVTIDYTFVFVPISLRIYFTACQLSLIHSMFF